MNCKHARPAALAGWLGAGFFCILLGFFSSIAMAGDRSATRQGDTQADNYGKQGQALLLDEVAVSAWDDAHTVGLQFDLLNGSHDAIKDLRVNAIAVQGGWYQGPAPFPLLLGKLAPDADRTVDAVFRLGQVDGCPHGFAIVGTYVQRGKTVHFKLTGVIRPTTAEPGPFPGRDGRAVKQSPDKVAYPPVKPQTPGNNAESPILIPPGPERQLFPLTPTPSDVPLAGLAPSARSPVQQQAAANVDIVRNIVSANSAGLPPDPNAGAAAPNGVVLATSNTSISFSTDGGATFTNVNLFTAIPPGSTVRRSFFPNSDGGLCCDQVVLYIPARNLFVWLLQYKPMLNVAGTAIAAPNRLRIAWATPEAIAANFNRAWTYADLTGAMLGVGSTQWVDYPDLAFSDTFLYVGVDHGSRLDRVFSGRRIVVRMRLSDIADASIPTVRFNRYELTGSNGLNKSHFVQGAPGRMVLGSLDNESTLRIFTLGDTSGSVSSSTVPISRITRGASYTSVAPDGSDWIAPSFPGNITGAAFRRLLLEGNLGFRDEYLFAFDAGVNAGAGRPRSYVRLETLTPAAGSTTRYNAFDEYDVFNADYAYAMAALGSDGREIGIALAVGGGTFGYPQFAVGYRGDFAFVSVTNSDATQTTRFGDYLSNRLVPGDRRLFGAAVYDVILNPLPPGVPSGTCATVGCNAQPRYVLWGRPQLIP